MIALYLTYQPFPLINVNRKVKAGFPENWSELSADQLTAIAALYKNRISDLRFLKIMSGFKTGWLRRMSDFDRYMLMRQINFISVPKSYHHFIIPNLKITVHLKSLQLKAPLDKLKAVTFAQFIFTDFYFFNYQETSSETDLNKFICALYLPENEPFEESRIEKRQSTLSQIPLSIREAIALNYQLINEWLTLAYPLVFRTRTEIIQSENQPAPSRDSTLWIKIFQNFVGDDIIHDKQWANTPVNTIFAYMTRKYKEMARQKSK